jgi:alkylation response protein AidB-like acyl-CoA dehydrogenase
MLQTTRRSIFSDEHAIFRDQVRRFLEREFTPNLLDWEAAGIIDKSFWRKCGAQGLLCPNVPEEFGGPALDYAFNTVVNEEMTYAGAPDCIVLQSDVILPYFLHYGSDAQKRHWLPRMVTGEIVTAIAMTEPDAGSDLQGIRTSARRSDGGYVINGSKTYITNGQNADLIIVAAKTDPGAGARGTSLLLVEADRSGFRRGRNLDKIGHWSADTSELFFDNVHVPAGNLLGDENSGFIYLVSQLAQERLSIAISAQAAAQRAFDEALAFTKTRHAFGQPIVQFQNTRFTLADIEARLQVGWAHLDWAIARHIAGKLTAAEAAAAKLWHTENQWLTVDAALQMHGGAGYMNEYPIARIWRDARVRRIYGGSSEILKDLIGKRL